MAEYSSRWEDRLFLVEDVKNYHIIEGDIFADKFRKKNVCICQQCNCITLKPHGLSADIVKHLGEYANSYGRRRAKPNTVNTATLETRAEPGTVDFCEGTPCVANLFAQFFYGSSSRVQYLSRKYLDPHIREGVNNDTAAKRLMYFKSCLNNLMVDLRNKYTYIDTVVFPHRIGCGMAGGSWADYQNVLLQFADKLSEDNITVFEVRNDAAIEATKRYHSRPVEGRWREREGITTD
uniref:Wsv206-like protein n=1 Tax=Penaeus semisulcatus majanivirus TaxID=2984274 RepID=A0A9C7BYY6_9VIRU|nr:MAG: wsv206-like protein [Penaeus semisulcatus majanivirus]